MTGGADELGLLRGEPHRRHDPLQDQWVLVSPGRTRDTAPEDAADLWREATGRRSS